jgi:hypothetical protein
MWKRYDGSRKPWTHAKLSNRGDAFGIIKLVRDGKSPKDYQSAAKKQHMAMCSFSKISYLTGPEQQQQANFLTEAIRKIDYECSNINLCSHDVYVCTPVGEDNDNIFSPGLNQLWMILDRGRHDILADVVMAARAKDEATAYFVSCPLDGGRHFRSVMCFQFDSFSTDQNPLYYSATVDVTTGFSSVYLEVSYTSLDSYVIIRWTCAVGTIEHWKDRGASGSRGPVVLWWTTTQEYNEFTYFMTKAIQIFEICHCYFISDGQLSICLNGGIGDDFQDRVGDDLIAGTYASKRTESYVWTTIPRGFAANAWTNCHDSWLPLDHR